MEDNKKQYLLLLSELIAKMAIVFGDIAILKARSISGLAIDNKGNVTDIEGYVADKVAELINEYMKLSDQAIKNIVNSTFASYPQLHQIK